MSNSPDVPGRHRESQKRRCKMYSTDRASENIEGAWAQFPGMAFDIGVYSPDDGRGYFQVLTKFSATMKERDDRQAAKPAGFVLSFQRSPDACTQGSIVITTYAEHSREVCMMPEGVATSGKAFKQVDEPGLLRHARTGRIVSPAIIAERLQRPAYSCPDIATQLRLREMIRELRKGT